jgi:5-methyltetrahydrofolate--homocysteine methyltransferase
VERIVTFLERVQQGITFFDGAMGTQIQSMEITDNEWEGNQGCNELLNLTAADKIQSIHRNYYEAGSDIVETNTFGASVLTLGEYELQDKTFEINRSGAEIARRAADEADTDRPLFVAGSVGPGTKLASLGQATYDQLYNSYKPQMEGLIAGGVDCILIETCQDLLQVKAAVNAVRDTCDETGREIPIIVSVTVETSGTMLVGSDIQAAITVLNTLKIDIMSMNCATGPAEMMQYTRAMSDMFNGPIMVYPNAGLPQNIDGEMVYDLKEEEFSQAIIPFVTELGVQLVGGCCGTTPSYITAVRNILDGVNPADRDCKPVPSIASLYNSQPLQQDPPPLFIGERTNTNGSKLFREKLLAEQWDSIVEVARKQEKDGAHSLDLCVAYTGRDENRDMTEAVSRITKQITIPLVIDSTQIETVEVALKLYGGKPVINSINLEDGEERAHAICRLATRYGAALIALTIDEEGMAREVDKKVHVAKRLYDIAVNQHGIAPHDLIFDPLTFTLGSGDETLKDAGINTLEGIKQIKAACPGVLTVLGLSNISFGLSPVSRKVLNSVYLAKAVEYGLDTAIVNVKHIIPLYRIDDEDKKVALDLIYNRGSENPLFTFINYFQDKTDSGTTEEINEDTLSLEERISKHIVDGNKSGMEDMLKEQLDCMSATDIINTILIPAMKIVGELFGSGQMQLPFVLQSAEVMKFSVDILEPFMEKTDNVSKTSIVLATVKGDVHDIGKNLVDIILSNNGFKVYNLGIKCEIDTMLEKAKEVGADAIGMSGLLVKSTIVMKENLEHMKSIGYEVPILLGGAALTRPYVEDTCDAILDKPVLYCEDAFAGLDAMSTIRDGKLDEYYKALLARKKKRPAPRRMIKPTDEKEEPVDHSIKTPEVPFLGHKIVKDISLDEIYPLLTEQVLFRGRWGFRRGKLSKEEFDTLIGEKVRPELTRLKQLINEKKLLSPKVAYGYYECNSDEQEAIIYHPQTGEEWHRIEFPRQKRAPYRCIADFFQTRKRRCSRHHRPAGCYCRLWCL